MQDIGTYAQVIFNFSDGCEPRPGSGPSIFLGIGLEILRRAQARPRLGINFFEKGLENWKFYLVKNRGRQGLGSNFCEGPGSISYGSTHHYFTFMTFFFIFCMKLLKYQQNYMTFEEQKMKQITLAQFIRKARVSSTFLTHATLTNAFHKLT